MLALEFHFKVGSNFRVFSWFDKTRQYLSDTFSNKSFFESWGGVALILLLPVAFLYLFLNLFDGTIYWLLTFITSLIVLFLCVGPSTIENSFASYFNSMEKGDSEAAYLNLNKIGSHSDDVIPENIEKAGISEKDELIRSATRKILTESQKSYFGVICWFIVFGPFGALFYRLSHIYYDHCKSIEFDEHLPLMERVIHWIEWVPSRVTSMLFLLTGDFVNGFYRIQDYLTDAQANNEQLISETGIASLGLEMEVNNGEVEENHRTVALVNRTIIFYLVVAAVLTSIF